MNNDLRWKQRFENFEKSFKVLQRRKDKYEEFPKDEGYQMAFVQAFEILFELSCKTLRDYLENQGIEVTTPRLVIKEAFKAEVIRKGEDWIEALKQRNNTSHVYDEKILKQVLEFVQVKFYPIVRDLYFNLKKEL